MKNIFQQFILIVLGVLLLSTMSIAAVPEKINIQGVITNKSTGDPLYGQDKVAKFQLWVKGKANTDVMAWVATQVLDTDPQGYFNVVLDLNAGAWQSTMFGPYTEKNVFNGDVWLKIIAFQDTFGPQPLLAAPFAIRAKYVDIADAYVEKDGDTMTGTLTVESAASYPVNVKTTLLGGTAIYGLANNATGAGMGVYGRSDGETGYGILAKAYGTKGTGLRGMGEGAEGVGVSGVGKKIGVEGSGATGGSFTSTSGNAVVGISNSFAGIKGETSSGNGVYGEASQNGAGVKGKSENGAGVYGFSRTNYALFSYSETGYGLYADAPKNYLSGNLGIGTYETSAPLAIQKSQAYINLITTSSPNGSVIQLINRAATKTYLGALNFGDSSNGALGQIAVTTDSIKYRINGENNVVVMSNATGLTSTGQTYYGVHGKGVVAGVKGESNDAYGAGLLGDNSVDAAALELQRGYIKIPSVQSKTTTSYDGVSVTWSHTMHSLTGTILHNRGADSSLITVTNKYVGPNSIVILSTLNNTSFGEKAYLQSIGSGYFRLYIKGNAGVSNASVHGGYKIGFLVINK